MNRLAGLIAATLAALCLLLTSPAARAADDGVTERLTLPAGSYIVDTGSLSPTVANGLKPYGLVYALVRQHQVPVWWVIEPTKDKDGVDFTDPASGRSYRGGPFVVSAEHVTPAVRSVLAQWQALGVPIDGPTTAPIGGVPVYQPITGLANTALDLKNGGIAGSFFTAAGIPLTAFTQKSPDMLTSCDDLFAMPHADPTWATHKHLLDHVRNRGSLWAGCHAVSVLENIDDPATPTVSPDMNFLSTSGLVPFGDHDDGSPPYSTARHGDPVMQFIGSTDAAQQGGSEQIYLPKSFGGWRPGAQLLVTDPSQADVPGASSGPAAAMVYGRAFDNPLHGRVMYEGGHNVGGSTPAAIAAQRAFLNFWLLAQLDRSPGVKAGDAVRIDALAEGATTSLIATVTHFAGVSFQWSSSGGGVFSAPNSASTTFTAPEVAADTTITIRVTVTDACGRVAFDAWPLRVNNVAKADLSIAKTAPSLVGAGQPLRYTLAVANGGTDTATDVTVTDVLPTGLTYSGASGSGWTCAYDAAARALRCTRPALAPTGSTPSTITVDTTAPAASGTLSNTAQVAAATPDPQPANNSATHGARVVSGIDLALTKTAPAGPVYAGQPYAYTLAVSNLGVLAATSVTVDDVLDPALSFVSAGGPGWDCVFRAADRRLTCFAASLAGAATSTITLRVQPSGAAGSVIANTARISSPDFSDTDPANDSAGASVTLGAPADLGLTASGSTTGGGGSQIDTHVVTLTNHGPGPALDIVVNDAMSGAGLAKYGAGCTVVASAGTLDPPSPWDIPTLAAGGRWRLPSLASGASATLSFSCGGDNNQGVTNGARVSAASFDPNPANDSASAYVIDGNVKTIDLALAKTAAPTSALVGGTLRYTLAVTNLSAGDDAKNDITVVDTLPAGASFISAADVVGTWSCSTGGNEVSCTTSTDAKRVGSSPNTLAVELLVRMPATAGLLTNRASVSMAPSSGVVDPPENNVASVSSPVRFPITDIAVTTAVDQPAPTLGGTVVISVEARNVGPEAATNLRLTDRLPTGLTLLSTATSQGSYDPATGLWYAGALASGESARLTLNAIAAEPGAWPTSACLYALDQTDGNPANDCAEVAVTPQLADLALAAAVDAPLVSVGDQARITFTLSHLGGSTASAIRVSPALPDGLQFVSAAAGLGSYDAASGHWTIAGPLAAGAGATLTVLARVTLAATPLTTSAVIVASSATDPVLANNQATVTVTGEAADIEISKTVDNAAPLALGTPLSFTIGAVNHGPTAARRLDVRELLPPGLDYVSHEASQGSYDPASGLWQAGALDRGATATLRVVAVNSRVGLLTNTATRIAVEPSDPGSTNDSATVRILSGGAADLSITKRVDKPATFQGDTVLFTVQLRNAGPDVATGVRAQDLLPPGLALIGHAASQGGYDAASGTWDLGTLAVGQRVTLTLQARVTGSGSLVNAASVSALDQADPDTSDNLATAAVQAAPAVDLAVALSGPGSATVGAPVTLALVARNRGPAAVDQASLTATVPAGIAVSSWTCVASGDADCDTAVAGSGASGSGGALSLDRVRIGTGANDFVSVSFTGSAASTGSFATTAIVSPPAAGTVFDTDAANNSARLVTIVGDSRLVGRVFADTGVGGGSANNGAIDGDEPGLAGRALRLTDCGATVHALAVTDADGRFTLGIPSSLAAGSVLCVVQANAAGEVSTGASAGTTGGTYDRASDTLRFTLAADTAYTGAAFGDVPENRLLADGARTALPGSTVVYPHSFIAGSAGQVGFSLHAAASPAAAGWSQTLFHDRDCDGTLAGDAGAADPPLASPLTMAAGERLCVVVQQFVPASLPEGASSLVTVQAFFAYTGATPALSAVATRQDLTTVSQSALQLDKSVRNLTQGTPWGTSNAARPGDLLEYRIRFGNLGVEPIRDLVVRDQTPAYTRFASGTCPQPLPAGLSACSLEAPAVDAAGAVVWRFAGDLASALAGAVHYTVRVD